MDSEKRDLMGLCQEKKKWFSRQPSSWQNLYYQRKPRSCVVDTCRQNHPPWVCKAFKELLVKKRKELVGIANRCFRCLAAGHHSREFPNVKRCGVGMFKY